MLRPVILVLLALLFFCGGALSKKAQIVRLTKENYEEVVFGSKKKVVLVSFTVSFDWCTQCGQVKGLLPDVVKAFKKERKVVVGEMAMEGADEMASRYGLTAFPGLFLFSSKHPEGKQYKGPIDALDIFNFVNKEAGTSAKPPKATSTQRKKPMLTGHASPVLDLTETSFDKATRSKAHGTFVEFYAPWCGHCKQLAPVWEAVGAKFQAAGAKAVLAKVEATHNPRLAKRYGIQGYPSLLWFPAGGSGEPEKYEGFRNERSLIKFLNKKAGSSVELPPPTPEEVEAERPTPVKTLHEGTFDAVVLGREKEQGVMVEFFSPSCGHCKQLEPTYKDLAAAYEPHPEVVIAKIDATQANRLADRYGVRGLPAIKWFGRGSAEPADYEGGRDLESFTGYINGRMGLKVVAKEGGGDEEQDPNSKLYVLSDKQFQEVALDSTKDVLVEFYAPWCGHCKKLAPILEEVAGHFEGSKMAVVAKLDATRHKQSAQKYGVKGYPTLLLFPQGGGEPIKFTGARDKTTLISFLESGGKAGV